ncbi:MAG: hypothetical protein GX085_01960 [Firmicutes bacterium]|nr:hypothetical protein [Bacillota bacterium]
MIFASLVELENPVLRLKKAGDILYAIAGKELIKIDSSTGRVIQREAIFPKDSKTRKFVIDKDAIYCRDFCRLYKIDLETLKINNTWELGTDLSSDICALGFDEDHVYASIRNGGFAVIQKATGEVKVYSVSESSIWEMIISDYIYAGNVAGELLVIDKHDIKVLKKEAIHKKNLKSLLLVGDVIYTASQDLSIAKVDKNTLETIASHKRCHKKMFYFAGIWRDFLLTVSPPCGEMKIWNEPDLSLYKPIWRGTWGSFIDGDILYEIGGNTIYCSNLNDLIADG